MKILFPYMARWHAVNWTRYHSLLVALAHEGHEIFVLQPPSMKSEETNFVEIERIETKNVNIFDVPLNMKIWNRKWPLEKLFKKGYYSLVAYKFAKKIVVEKNIDVVLIYNIPQYTYLNLSPAKVVFDYADDYVDMLAFELGRLSNGIVTKFATWLLHRMMKKSYRVTSVSHELAKLAEGEVVVLPNGVSYQKSILGSKIDVPVNNNGKPVVGFIGSFEYFIDFDLILHAAKACPLVHFLLVGTGRDWDSVNKKAKEMGIQNIELTGGVGHEKVFSYINKMDICLNIFKKIPVSHRACPIKLFEYISLKKPVISTRLKELDYIDEDFIYYADSAEELAERIGYLLKNQQEASEKAKKAYTIVGDKYTWESIGNQFVKMI